MTIILLKEKKCVLESASSETVTFLRYRSSLMVSLAAFNRNL